MVTDSGGNLRNNCGTPTTRSFVLSGLTNREFRQHHRALSTRSKFSSWMALTQARRKEFRVGPAKIGASTLGGSGGMLPREILKFSFSKITFGAFSERIKKKTNQNLR